MRLQSCHVSSRESMINGGGHGSGCTKHPCQKTLNWSTLHFLRQQKMSRFIRKRVIQDERSWSFTSLLRMKAEEILRRLKRHHSNRRNRRLPFDEENVQFQRFCDVSSVIISTSIRTIVGLVCVYMHVGIAVHVHVDKSRRMCDVVI